VPPSIVTRPGESASENVVSAIEHFRLKAEATCGVPFRDRVRRNGTLVVTASLQTTYLFQARLILFLIGLKRNTYEDCKRSG